MPNTNITLTDLFTDIADAIRGKDGTSADITASDFPTRITAIPSGGGSVSTTISGNMQYLDYIGQWDNLINNPNVTITTSDLSDLYHMFDGASLSSIPFSFNYISGTSKGGTRIRCSFMFSGCNNLETVDISSSSNVYFDGGNNGKSMFQGCYRLRTITGSNVRAFGGGSMFAGCYSLREIPNILMDNYSSTNAGISPYVTAFQQCFSLNKIVDLPVHYITADGPTSNCFTNTFSACNRINRLTFETLNGSPYSSYMTNQTIDLSIFIGYTTNVSKINILNYNSGITADKEVTDATSYDALKNDPDWFTLDAQYSRYNHDSAVETINSLPNTSAYIATKGGTNTIKFNGASGSATDGGAINTLTAAEIAVATAKGWTVTLV